MVYTLTFEDNWDKHFKKMDNSVKEILWKKIQKQKQETKTRHLKYGIEFSVIEVSQYRISLKINEKEKTKRIAFVGNHKQYEKWYKNL